MKRIRFAARIYSRDGAEFTGRRVSDTAASDSGCAGRVQDDRRDQILHPQMVSIHGLCRIRRWIGRSEKPPDASRQARARRNLVVDRNRRGAAMTKADQPEITRHKRSEQLKRVQRRKSHR
jgi:hypothetical protein